MSTGMPSHSILHTHIHTKQQFSAVISPIHKVLGGGRKQKDLQETLEKLHTVSDLSSVSQTCVAGGEVATLCAAPPCHLRHHHFESVHPNLLFLLHYSFHQSHLQYIFGLFLLKCNMCLVANALQKDKNVRVLHVLCSA